jgi:hypothetical protein
MNLPMLAWPGHSIWACDLCSAKRRARHRWDPDSLAATRDPAAPPDRLRSSDVNGAQRGVDWQMKIGDARCKLASVYPKIRL